jgi:glutamine amidotransferase
MGAIVAILQSSPGLLRCQVERLSNQIALPGEEPPSGWGFGWYAPADVLLGRRPSGGGAPPALPDLVGTVEGEALVVHAGRPTGGPPKDENTQPFRHRRWLFALSGAVEGWAEVRPRLAAALPDHLRRSVHGDTDAEHLFMLLLAELRAEVPLDDPELPAAAVGRALARTVRRADALCREAGVTAPSRLGLVVTNGRVLGATRRGGPLSYALLEGIVPCPRHGITRETSEADPRVAAHRHLRAVVLASHPADLARFVEVPPASVVTVSRTLQVTVGSLGAAV